MAEHDILDNESVRPPLVQPPGAVAPAFSGSVATSRVVPNRHSNRPCSSINAAGAQFRSTIVKDDKSTGTLALALLQIEENFNLMNSTIFVLFGKYCPIMDQLGSKDSSRDFQLNCVISYFFTYI
jgi:hypothetical protein